MRDDTDYTFELGIWDDRTIEAMQQAAERVSVDHVDKLERTLALMPPGLNADDSAVALLLRAVAASLPSLLTAAINVGAETVRNRRVFDADEFAELLGEISDTSLATVTRMAAAAILEDMLASSEEDGPTPSAKTPEDMLDDKFGPARIDTDKARER